jgi:hypothetical protein
MRIRCERRLVTSGEKRGLELEPPLPPFPEIGAEYLVLAVRVGPRPPRGILPTDLLILDELREPVWVSAAEFSVTDDRLPSVWRTALSPDGELELAPPAWLRPGFWGEYYSETKETAVNARTVFKEEVALLEAADGTTIT